jgi:hypothetical protein
MSNPVSVQNSSSQAIDTLYNAAGQLRIKLGVGSKTDPVSGQQIAWQGVATHQDGDTFGTNDGVVALAGTDGTTIRRLVVDSSGHLSVVATGLVSVLTGTGHKNVASTGTAIALRASTVCKVVTVKADTGNAATIFVGISTVTNDETATTGGLQLEPGESTSISVADLATVFINGTTGDGVSYMWEV